MGRTRARLRTAGSRRHPARRLEELAREARGIVAVIYWPDGALDGVRSDGSVLHTRRVYVRLWPSCRAVRTPELHQQRQANDAARVADFSGCSGCRGVARESRRGRAADWSVRGYWPTAPVRQVPVGGQGGRVLRAAYSPGTVEQSDVFVEFRRRRPDATAGRQQLSIDGERPLVGLRGRLLPQPGLVRHRHRSDIDRPASSDDWDWGPLRRAAATGTPVAAVGGRRTPWRTTCKTTGSSRNSRRQRELLVRLIRS